MSPEADCTRRTNQHGEHESGKETATILVVDDEHGVRNITCRLLGRYGYDVLSAADGTTAVEIFRQWRGCVDLVLLDMTLPKLSGREVFEQIRSLSPEIPIIIVSGETSEDIQDITGTPCSDFIMKPYRSGELKTRIESFLSKN